MEKITIPKFMGEQHKWTKFREMFEVMVHNKQVDNSVKFARLLKAIGGDAEPVVSGFTFIGANYEAAWTALKHRYDNKKKIFESHLAIFLNAEPLQEENAIGIRHILDVTNETVMSLTAQGVPAD